MELAQPRVFFGYFLLRKKKVTTTGARKALPPDKSTNPMIISKQKYLVESTTLARSIAAGRAVSVSRFF